MTWFDQLQPASFKDVPFHVDSSQVTEGDASVIRGYPFQDLPSYQSMGEGQDEIKLSAYVIGEDAVEKRDKLREVLRGEGVLIHPTRGAMRVFVQGRFSWREAYVTQGCVTRFDVTFVRAGEAQARRYPQAIANPKAQLKDATQATTEALAESFTLDFDGAGYLRIDALSTLWSMVAKIEGYFDSVHSEIAATAAFARNVSSLRGRLESLLSRPADLITDLQNLLALGDNISATQAQANYTAAVRLSDLFKGGNLTSTSAANGSNSVDDGEAVPAGNGSNSSAVEGSISTGSGSLYNVNISVPMASPYVTPSRIKQQQNTVAIYRAVQVLALTHAATAIAHVDAMPLPQLAATREHLHKGITALLLQADNQVLSQSLSNLHTVSMLHINSMSGYHRVSSYTDAQGAPLVVTCYHLYGNTKHIDELRGNNPHIAHPLLVSANTELQVVAHG